MSSNSYERDSLQGSPGYAEFVADAMAAGLTLVSLPVLDCPTVLNVYAVRPENIWRAHAHHMLTQVCHSYGWNDSVEALQSAYLGYSSEEVQHWITTNRQHKAAWNAVTVYCLLTARHVQLVSEVARRAFTRESLAFPLSFFFHTGNYTCRSDAWRFLQQGSTLARMGLEMEFVKRTFKGACGYGVLDSIIQKTITADQTENLNEALRSRIEFLTAEGWS